MEACSSSYEWLGLVPMLFSKQGPWFIVMFCQGVLLSAGAFWFWPVVTSPLRKKDKEQQKEIDALKTREAKVEEREHLLQKRDDAQGGQLGAQAALIRELTRRITALEAERNTTMA